jgi:glycosyltransferase involved in cell wall biosynthesis
LIAAAREISALEPALFPDSHLLSVLAEVPAPGILEEGRAYLDLMRLFTHKLPSHIVFAPWLGRGGADLGTVHHIRALAQEFSSKVMLITTERAESPWLRKLPPSVPIIEFGRKFGRLDESIQITILMRALLQIRPAVIHNMNSRLCWELFSTKGQALSQFCKLFASCFCDDFSEEGKSTHYCRTHLVRCYQHLTRIFSDNDAYPKSLCASSGYDLSRFTTLYFPTDTIEEAAPAGTTHAICWAGRITPQKRPDILAAVAAALPEVIFHVYGPLSKQWNDPSLNKLKSLKNVRFMGPYDDFKTIARKGYTALLYTSSWDGLPNILLEASSARLPVIAPDIGGIPELIDNNTGILVSNPDAVAEYIDAIRWTITNPKEMISRSEKLYQKIRKVHSWQNFIDQLGHIPEYIRPSS